MKCGADLLTPSVPLTQHSNLRKVWGNVLTDNHSQRIVIHSFSNQVLILTEGSNNLLHFIFKLSEDLVFNSWRKQVMCLSF